MDLKDIVKNLETIAPLKLAESWDNVGLLLEPSAPHLVKNILLTNDLTEPVFQEALRFNVNMIISYHPPIFHALKKITQNQWQQRLIVKCIENGIAIYSPHTVWDSFDGGINDWLLQPFHELISTKYSIANSSSYEILQHVCYLTIEDKLPEAFMNDMSHVLNLTEPSSCSFEMMCSNDDEKGNVILRIPPHKMADVFALLYAYNINPLAIRFDRVDDGASCTGSGRIASLKEPLTLDNVVQRVKKHLKLDHVLLAIAHGQDKEALVSRIAVCAGAGASLLVREKSALTAQLLLTGEMSHHEVAEAVARGQHVLLTLHSNSERGFLTDCAVNLLHSALPDVQIRVAIQDKDPLGIV